MNLSEIQVDTNAIRRNVEALRSRLKPGTQVAAVVKGDAYGHGLHVVVPALESVVEYLQVDDIEELRRVRSLSKLPVLVLGYVLESDLPEALALDADLGAFDAEHVAKIGGAGRRAGRKAKVHLEVDALLGRMGATKSALTSLYEEVGRWDEIEVEGLYAHFANIEDTTDLVHALAQEAAFEEARAAFGRDVLTHISATSGAMTVEETHPRDLVRLGIGVYGMYPSAALARTTGWLELTPALRWVSRLAQVKRLPARYPVGYGLTYVTPRDTLIGIVPQGYSDGYDRGLSNSGEVLVHGKRCPVIGRIAMNMFAVDLSRAPDAKAEDEVVLLGAQGTDTIDAEEIAARLGTINYEVTARISPLLPRIPI